jgi:arylsulfatase
VGDIIHETDLFTTFARLGGATQHIPTDRIVDGIDQTALFLNGDTNGRRDHVFIYAGPELGATVKGNVKKHWIAAGHGAASGLGASYYDLLNDTREAHPTMVNFLHVNESFSRMKIRHELWKKKYPDSERAHAPAFTGLANARPETRALSKPPANLKELPFDVLEFIEHDLPYDGYDPDMGQ